MTMVHYDRFIQTNAELIAAAMVAEAAFRKLGDVLPDLAPDIRACKRQRRRLTRKLRRLRARHG